MADRARESLDRVVRRLAEARTKQRRYASFFQWRNKDVMERGVATEFLRSLETSEGTKLLHLRRPRGEPPDFFAEDAAGGLVGIEITEFVSEEAVRRNERGDGVFRMWKPQEVEDELRRIVGRKDGKRFTEEGPARSFSRRILVIHTDEGMLSPGPYVDFLREATFGPVEQFTDAFLLFSYYPGEPAYPIIRLRLK